MKEQEGSSMYFTMRTLNYRKLNKRQDAKVNNLHDEQGIVIIKQDDSAFALRIIQNYPSAPSS